MAIRKKNVYKVKIHNASGDKFVVFSNGDAVPLEMCALGAGKDAWMRTIETKCRECKCTFKLNESDSVYYCQDCYDNDDVEG